MFYPIFFHVGEEARRQHRGACGRYTALTHSCCLIRSCSVSSPIIWGRSATSGTADSESLEGRASLACEDFAENRRIFLKFLGKWTKRNQRSEGVAGGAPGEGGRSGFLHKLADRVRNSNGSQCPIVFAEGFAWTCDIVCHQVSLRNHITIWNHSARQEKLAAANKTIVLPCHEKSSMSSEGGVEKEGGEWGRRWEKKKAKNKNSIRWETML